MRASSAIVCFKMASVNATGSAGDRISASGNGCVCATRCVRETRLTAYVLVFFPDYSTSASYLFSTMPH